MANEAEIIKELRKNTGAPITDCKKVLSECCGQMEKARIILLEKGFDRAQKREGKSTGQGIIVSYVHHNTSVGVLVEINCETDFVARNETFKELAKEVAMQIAACHPMYISREDIPQGIITQIPEIERETKIKAMCLMEQANIRDSSLTIADMVKRAIAKIGENIKIRRFVRYEVGEQLEI